MLGAVVAQIAAVLAADKDTRLARQASPTDLAVGRPARRTIGRDVTRLARAPSRPVDGGLAAQKSGRPRQRPRSVEYLRRIRLILIPPRKDCDRMSTHLTSSH